MAAPIAAPDRDVIRPADQDHPPAVREEPPDQRPSSGLDGHRLAAVPAAEVDREQWGILAESARVEPVGPSSHTRRGTRRTAGRVPPEIERPDRPTARRPDEAVAAVRPRPGVAEPLGDMDAVDVRGGDADPRAGPSSSMPESVPERRAKSRPDFVAAGDPFGDVGEQEAAAAHRPAEAAGDAGEGQGRATERMSPRTSIPRS